MDQRRATERRRRRAGSRLAVTFPRVQEEEWLDEDLGTQAEIASALRSLRWVKRLFGGNACIVECSASRPPGFHQQRSFT